MNEVENGRMIDYKSLKHNENGMPTWDGFLGPLLKVASTKQLWKRRDLINATLKEVPLPNNLASMRYTSKWHDLVAPDRMNWALSDLKTSAILNSPRRGYYQISELGRKILKDHGLNITAELVHSQPAFIEHQKKMQAKNAAKNSDDDEDLSTVFELSQKQIESWFDKQNSDLAEKLLIKMRNSDPYQFENMMVDLLGKMGYKGINGKAFVTQKSNDGGVDGILNQDPLGLQKTYVQVKRYAQDNVVGSPEINSFYGALGQMNASRGVFITTSSFTSGAVEAGKRLGISLVDGDMLTNLMLQFEVGVQVKHDYKLFKIDDDFFEND